MGLKSATGNKGKRREVALTLPVCGEQLRAVGMLRKEHREWQESLLNEDGSDNDKKNELSTELLVARVCVDELGNREISDAEVMDGIFDSFDSADWSYLSREVCELVFGKRDEGVKEALKNLKTPGSDSSGSSSPKQD